MLDGEKEQKGREVAELQTRLSLEEQREEERGRDIFSLKQRLTEADTVRNCIKKEVRIEGWMLGGSKGEEMIRQSRRSQVLI